MAYTKEQRWGVRYTLKSAMGADVEKAVMVRSKEKMDDIVARCKEAGYRVVEAGKLYPFSMAKNQHNFLLISNICFSRMHDMEIGAVPEDNEEYKRLQDLRHRAQKYMSYIDPVAWVTWNEYKDMKELSTMAVLKRQDMNIEAGRADFVPYC